MWECGPDMRITATPLGNPPLERANIVSLIAQHSLAGAPASKAIVSNRIISEPNQLNANTHTKLTSLQTSKRPQVVTPLRIHRVEEVRIALGLFELVDQELDCIGRSHR